MNRFLIWFCCIFTFLIVPLYTVLLLYMSLGIIPVIIWAIIGLSKFIVSVKQDGFDDSIGYNLLFFVFFTINGPLGWLMFR